MKSLVEELLMKKNCHPERSEGPAFARTISKVLSLVGTRAPEN
jgi:hypothetical protein